MASPQLIQADGVRLSVLFTLPTLSFQDFNTAQFETQTFVLLHCLSPTTRKNKVLITYHKAGIDLPEQKAHDVLEVSPAWPAQCLEVDRLLVTVGAEVVRHLVQ